ncbi:hypothetical protein H9P43_001624 [Blastocladiella emersonii ATCC 22665]|nr:hypothetical protein H9P43_001624 [Blastocladiella emersonii ATCC 22665]
MKQSKMQKKASRANLTTKTATTAATATSVPSPAGFLDIRQRGSPGPATKVKLVVHGLEGVDSDTTHQLLAAHPTDLYAWAHTALGFDGAFELMCGGMLLRRDPLAPMPRPAPLGSTAPLYIELLRYHTESVPADDEDGAPDPAVLPAGALPAASAVPEAEQQFRFRIEDGAKQYEVVMGVKEGTLHTLIDMFETLDGDQLAMAVAGADSLDQAIETALAIQAAADDPTLSLGEFGAADDAASVATAESSSSNSRSATGSSVSQQDLDGFYLDGAKRSKKNKKNKTSASRSPFNPGLLIQPEVKRLMDLFPGFPVDALESCLAHHGGDLDLAADYLAVNPPRRPFGCDGACIDIGYPCLDHAAYVPDDVVSAISAKPPAASVAVAASSPPSPTRTPAPASAQPLRGTYGPPPFAPPPPGCAGECLDTRFPCTEHLALVADDVSFSSPGAGGPAYAELAQQQQQQPAISPRLELECTLAACYPHIPAARIRAVLEANGGDPNAAVTALENETAGPGSRAGSADSLAASPPDWVPAAAPSVASTRKQRAASVPLHKAGGGSSGSLRRTASGTTSPVGDDDDDEEEPEIAVFPPPKMHANPFAPLKSAAPDGDEFKPVTGKSNGKQSGNGARSRKTTWSSIKIPSRDHRSPAAINALTTTLSPLPQLDRATAASSTPRGGSVDELAPGAAMSSLRSKSDRELEAELERLHAQRGDRFGEAHFASKAGRFTTGKGMRLGGQVAMYRAEEGHALTTRIYDIEDEIARRMVRSRQAQMPADRAKYSIDLHLLTVRQAEAVVKEDVERWWHEETRYGNHLERGSGIHPLTIVVGIGLHSKGASKLGPAMVTLLREMGYRFIDESKSRGQLIVTGVV